MEIYDNETPRNSGFVAIEDGTIYGAGLGLRVRCVDWTLDHQEVCRMTMRLITRHSEDFDIYSKPDLAKSPYAREGYVPKIQAFYATLKVESVIWTFPENFRPQYLESEKTIEYLLEVDDARIVAYVDDIAWSSYLYGQQANFDYSLTRKDFECTSILIRAPLAIGEVKERRRYRSNGSPDKYEMVERKVL